MFWHILDTNSIWVKEFASAMSRLAPTLGWSPQISFIGAFERWEREITLSDPALRIRCFPMQRGYRYRAVAWISRTTECNTERLSRSCPDVRSSTLVCTSPFYAAIAEQWHGPAVYYATDHIARYDGVNTSQVAEMEERICRAVTMVCPNSKRIARHLVDTARCARKKILVIPQATRSSNILPEPPGGPGQPPPDIADLPRPLAGVIGNLAANMDWVLLQAVIDGSPAFTWVFVGPVDMPIRDRRQRKAREDLLRAGGRVRFIGGKPYGELRGYARAFDVAVMPYRKQEPNYSGSATRFYEHLAACRPMVSTRGVAELLEKEPLLLLASTPEEMICRLESLRAADFQDGNEFLRWKRSHGETWEARAAAMVHGLDVVLQIAGLPG
jgi:hypothetical protein